MLTQRQMEADILFLAKRAADAGTFSTCEDRDYGLSSNSLVGMAYGIGRQFMPSDWGDYAACVRAVRKLPRHRLTSRIRAALAKARAAVERKYPAAGRRAYFHSKQKAA